MSSNTAEDLKIAMGTEGQLRRSGGADRNEQREERHAHGGLLPLHSNRDQLQLAKLAQGSFPGFKDMNAPTATRLS